MNTNNPDLYKPEETEDKSARIIFTISPENKIAFGKLCQDHQTTMSTVLRKFVEQEVNPVAK